jgi:hypothetical protein
MGTLRGREGREDHVVTALADLLRPADRQALENRRRELDELARLMRQPGGLAGSPEPPALQDMARDAITEMTTAS